MSATAPCPLGSLLPGQGGTGSPPAIWVPTLSVPHPEAGALTSTIPPVAHGDPGKRRLGAGSRDRGSCDRDGGPVCCPKGRGVFLV